MDALGEAPGLGWAKENPGGYPPRLHSHFVAFVLLLMLVELDGTESNAVAVEELAAGIIVQPVSYTHLSPERRFSIFFMATSFRTGFPEN